jgi:hypothetical protein
MVVEYKYENTRSLLILDFPWQRRNVSEKAVVVLVEDVKISD